MRNRIMPFFAATVFAALMLGCSEDEKIPRSMTIVGGGASFPAPAYQIWTYTYTQNHPNVKISYQSLGSGAGINQIKVQTLDFAGTDNPLTFDEQQEAGVVQFPMLMGGVVVIVNVPGIENNQIRLSRDALAGIFLGRITHWSDAEIATTNPELKLPDLSITVVRRADASGTNFIFTNYLSKISPAWYEHIGFGVSVKWPIGIGGQKNPGVCNSVAQISGAIGYTEYTYAVESRLATALLENQNGKYVAPTPEAFSASAVSADWQNAPGFYMILTDQPGDDSWPITGVTYILMRKDYKAGLKKELINYFNWCYTSGSAAAHKLHYVPMPENVIDMVCNEIFK